MGILLIVIFLKTYIIVKSFHLFSKFFMQTTTYLNAATTSLPVILASLQLQVNLCAFFNVIFSHGLDLYSFCFLLHCSTFITIQKSFWLKAFFFPFIFVPSMHVSLFCTKCLKCISFLINFSIDTYIWGNGSIGSWVRCIPRKARNASLNRPCFMMPLVNALGVHLTSRLSKFMLFPCLLSATLFIFSFVVI